MKLKWKKKTKALEINVNKDREVHCILQLESVLAPDGGIFQLVGPSYYSQSQGISRKSFLKVEFLVGRKSICVHRTYCLPNILP